MEHKFIHYLVIFFLPIFVSAEYANAIMRQSPQMLCGVRIPSGLIRYRIQVEKDYGAIRCSSKTDGDYAFAKDGGAYINLTPADSAEVAIASHELMHLWLGTQKWDVSDTRRHFVAPPGMDPEAVDIFGSLLMEYLEHRIFENKLKANGIDEHRLQMKIASYYLELFIQPGQWFYAATPAVYYLLLKLSDDEAGSFFTKQFSSKDKRIVIKLWTAFDNMINKANPQTEATALDITQKCINIAFSTDSEYCVKIYP